MQTGCPGVSHFCNKVASPLSCRCVLKWAWEPFLMYFLILYRDVQRILVFRPRSAKKMIPRKFNEFTKAVELSQEITVGCIKCTYHIFTVCRRFFKIPFPKTSVQFRCSVVSNSATPWTAARQASLSITNSRSLRKLMSIGLVVPSDHLILYRPLLLLLSIFPSIGVFSDKSVLCIRWPKYWSFSFSISPSSEYSGLVL